MAYLETKGKFTNEVARILWHARRYFGTSRDDMTMFIDEPNTEVFADGKPRTIRVLVEGEEKQRQGGKQIDIALVQKMGKRLEALLLLEVEESRGKEDGVQVVMSEVVTRILGGSTIVLTRNRGWKGDREDPGKLDVTDRTQLVVLLRSRREGRRGKGGVDSDWRDIEREANARSRLVGGSRVGDIITRPVIVDHFWYTRDLKQKLGSRLLNGLERNVDCEPGCRQRWCEDLEADVLSSPEYRPEQVAKYLKERRQHLQRRLGKKRLPYSWFEEETKKYWPEGVPANYIDNLFNARAVLPQPDRVRGLAKVLDFTLVDFYIRAAHILEEGDIKAYESSTRGNDQGSSG